VRRDVWAPAVLARASQLRHEPSGGQRYWRAMYRNNDTGIERERKRDTYIHTYRQTYRQRERDRERKRYVYSACLQSWPLYMYICFFFLLFCRFGATSGLLPCLRARHNSATSPRGANLPRRYWRALYRTIDIWIERERVRERCAYMHACMHTYREIERDMEREPDMYIPHASRRMINIFSFLSGSARRLGPCGIGPRVTTPARALPRRRVGLCRDVTRVGPGCWARFGA